jgi:hypothetical protein
VGPPIRVQAPGSRKYVDKVSSMGYCRIMKDKLKQINDELLKFYNRPGMALHFQPTNLKVLKNLIIRLIKLENENK